MEANNERVQKRVDWAQANEERETAERLNGRMDFLRESASALKPYLVA